MKIPMTCDGFRRAVNLPEEVIMSVKYRQIAKLMKHVNNCPHCQEFMSKRSFEKFGQTKAIKP